MYLRQAKGKSRRNPQSIPAKGPSKPEVENASAVEVQEPEEKIERNDEKNTNIEGVTEQSIGKWRRRWYCSLFDYGPLAQVADMISVL